MPFCTRKTWSFLVTHYFVYGGIVACAHQRFCCLCSFCSLLFFALSLIFTLLAASISHFLTATMKFSCFFSQKNSSPLFFISPSSSFSVIHVSVDIKNSLEKDSTLLLCFLSKSPGGHAISRQKRLDLPVLIDHFTVILAFKRMRGWGWRCFDTNLHPFLMEIMLKKY